MSNEADNTGHQTFGNDSGIQVNEEKTAESSLSTWQTDHCNLAGKWINPDLDEIHNLENGTPAVDGEEDFQKLEELLNMDASSSNTMALLASTFSPKTDETMDEDVTYITLEDDDDVSTSALSSKVNPQLNNSKVSGSTSKKPISKKKKKTLREKMKMLNQKRAEKRERLKLEGEKRLELELDNFDEPIAEDPSPSEYSPTVQSVSASEDGGYVKAGHRLRGATYKRPPNYDTETLQQWAAMQEEKRLIREQQKVLDFKEEMKKIELKRFRNKKMKTTPTPSTSFLMPNPLIEKTTKNGESMSLAFLNAISESIDNNNDDVEIVKVVTKPKKKTTLPTSTTSTPKPRISLEAAKMRNKLRVIQPVPPKPYPIVCLPSSCIRRAPLHTLPISNPRNPVIRFPQSGVPQSKKPPVTDECFSSVPCSSSSTSASNNITVPPPIYSTTSKRVQLKKQAAKLNSELDDEVTVFDECCFSVPCEPAINANDVNIPPQHSTMLTVPVSSQPTLIPQFSTLLSSSASISAPLQLTQQVQTFSIPANLLPPPGTPLQIVFILPSALVPATLPTNGDTSTPQIISPSPSPNNPKVIEVKCEMKE